jgi:hypothetical protein
MNIRGFLRQYRPRKTPFHPEKTVVCAGFAVYADSIGISLVQMEEFRGGRSQRGFLPRLR